MTPSGVVLLQVQTAGSKIGENKTVVMTAFGRIVKLMYVSDFRVSLMLLFIIVKRKNSHTFSDFLKINFRVWLSFPGPNLIAKYL